MNLPLRKPDVAPSELRALTFFGALPPGHITFLVADDGSAPHLKIGEFAVIDTTDRELQNGEVYLIQYESGQGARRISQIRTDYIGVCTKSRLNGRRTLVWWARDLAGIRHSGEAHGIPVLAGMSDGPYNQRHLKKKLLGRVVGYAEAPLGGLIEPCLGCAD
jgi:hypothetical protein